MLLKLDWIEIKNNLIELDICFEEKGKREKELNDM